MGIEASAPTISAYDAVLLSISVALVERETGDILDRIAVKIDLELVHALRMVARLGNFAGDSALIMPC
ncbi:MAG TPA: hypothetical protein VK822_06135 [Acetobacteraceae bacterium]|jgi:hypothetical protein|nr:hypothetical protein [Acetobacteraceae bacterium]